MKKYKKINIIISILTLIVMSLLINNCAIDENPIDGTSSQGSDSNTFSNINTWSGNDFLAKTEINDWKIKHWDEAGSTDIRLSWLVISNGYNSGSIMSTANTASVAYRPMPEYDFEMTVKVSAITSINYTSLIGVFENCDDPSTPQWVIQSSNNYNHWGIATREKRFNETIADYNTEASLLKDFYLKLIKSGDNYKFQYSLDGTTYTDFTSQYNNFTTDKAKYIGLLSSSAVDRNVQVFYDKIDIIKK